MSAWSDYKCGAITEEDYRFECMKEARADEDYDTEESEGDE